MENASKALILAGSILIAILLITVGMVIFRDSKKVTDQSSLAMSALEIQLFNEQFTKYNGTQSLAQVQKLLSIIITNNTNNSNKKIHVRGFDKTCITKICNNNRC